MILFMLNQLMITCNPEMELNVSSCFFFVAQTEYNCKLIIALFQDTIFLTLLPWIKVLKV